MTQLHEVLAVEKTAEQQAKKLLRHSIATLGKENLFNGHTKTLTYFSSENEHLNSKETVTLESTVDENLEYTFAEVAKWLDVVLTKDTTNQNANADLEVEGKVIATDVPATFLLGLETKLNEIRAVYEAVHTLAPGKEWIPDLNEREGVYKTVEPEVQFKEEKTMQYDVVVQPTEHHPAQVKERTINEKVGKYVTTRVSGLMTPKQKAACLERIDTLLVAVKKARQRANQVEIVNDYIGDAIFQYIREGI